MPNPLQQLHSAGQSFWFDNIRRQLLTSGELARMVREDGLRGLTSNPTIFAKALSNTADYDASIRPHMELATADVFLELMIEDIRAACDVLRPVYDSSGGRDGFASIEVFPGLARDGAGTITQARDLWRRVARPNVMVKIPSTPECIEAIHIALREGININITLMFSLGSYEAVVEAYLAALEARLAAGLAIDNLNSVASLFVSRVDTRLDPKLASHPELQGKAGIANARLMYRHFQQAFQGARWEALRARGAAPQRLLWASTSTKNPKYSDTLYADALVGPDTVDTMPDATVAAFRDHGHAVDRLTPAVAAFDHEVKPVLDGLAQAGINLDRELLALQDEGVDSFQKSYVELIAGLAAKIGALKAEGAAKAFADRDTAYWGGDEAARRVVANRLGWMDLPAAMRTQAAGLDQFAAQVQGEGYRHAILLGMGGSSLAPEVFAKIFNETRLRLHVLDTTDPDAIARAAIDLQHTLIIVSSKSGGTIEPNSLFAWFWSQLADGSHYIAITDPGTSLAQLAADHKFRRVFLNPSDLGGRYSALSYFGLVPAALVGVDVAKLLDRAGDAAAIEAAGIALGTQLGAWQRQGRDKLTFLTSPELAPLGAWLEQLIAESTGKHGRGIVPVEGEPLGAAAVYGDDRAFATLQLAGAPALTPPSGAPSIAFTLQDRYDLGRQFLLWEYATAVAGAVMGVNPFDEPNVQESKDNTARVLGEMSAGKPLAPEPPSDLDTWLGSIRPGSYVAIMAYLERTEANIAALCGLRLAIRDRFHVATTVGFGPRFLHSTGQLHKGGTPDGVFLQITAPPAQDLPVPGHNYSFATLFAAQSRGDAEALRTHGLPLFHLVLGADTAAGIERFSNSLAETGAAGKAAD